MRKTCVPAQVPVIVMCNYCTEKNFDGLPPETMSVDGADGVVYIPRGDLDAGAWLKLKRKVLTVLREFRANKSRGVVALGGGDGTRADAIRRVKFAEDVIMVETDPGDVEDLVDALNDAGAGGDEEVKQADDGVSPDLVEYVEDFVQNTRVSSDDALKAETLSVLAEMADGTDEAEAREFATEVAAAAMKEFAEQVNAEVDTLQAAIDPSLFQDAAVKFRTTATDAAEDFSQMLTNIFISDVGKVVTDETTYMMSTSKEDAIEKSKQFLNLSAARQDVAVAVSKLELKINQGIEAADALCPPCRKVDLDYIEHAADKSGVRTVEPDQRVGSACALVPHPLRALITQATEHAQSAKAAWAPLAYAAAFLRAYKAPPGAATQQLLSRLNALLQGATDAYDTATVEVSSLLKQVKQIVGQNRVFDLPTGDLVTSVKLEKKTDCSQERVSAVLGVDQVVRLVVMDGDMSLGREANLKEAWAAAHEAQASLARYRMAHALYRAAELGGNAEQAKKIREKIIDLQVDEILQNVASIGQELETAVNTTNSRALTPSVPWLQREGYVRCLQWFTRLVTEGKAALRTALKDHKERIAGLQSMAQQRWDNERDDKAASVQTDCNGLNSADLAKLQQQLQTAKDRLEKVPTLTGTGFNEVEQALQIMHDTLNAIDEALVETAAHSEWREHTFCSYRDNRAHSLALPFFAEVAEGAATAIARRARTALQAYKDADQSFQEATNDLVLCTYEVSDKPKRVAVASVLLAAMRDLTAAVHVSHVGGRPTTVTLLLQLVDDDVPALRNTPAVVNSDIATCKHLADLLLQFGDGGPDSVIIAIAAVLQPGEYRRNTTDNNLDTFLWRSKYGLAGVGTVTEPTPQTIHTEDVPQEMQDEFVRYAAAKFNSYVYNRQNRWNDAAGLLSQKRNALSDALKSRRNGDPVKQPLVSNACLDMYFAILTRVVHLQLPTDQSAELQQDFRKALRDGMSLHALSLWVSESIRLQTVELRKLVEETRPQPQDWLTTSIHNALNNVVYGSDTVDSDAYELNSFMVAVNLLRGTLAKAEGVCKTLDVKDDDVTGIVEAQVKARKAIATAVNTALNLTADSNVHDVITKQTWREFWVAPNEAYAEWTATNPLNPPEFFTHVFPQKDGDTVQRGTYDSLVETLKGAPPSMYMYAFLQAKKWLASKIAAENAVKGGARGRAVGYRQDVVGTYASAPSGHATRVVRPAVEFVEAHSRRTDAGGPRGGALTSADVDVADHVVGLKSSVNGGGRDNGAPGRSSATLRSKPTADLGGALRRAVTLLVLENARISAATCCTRILAGKFAQGTRRADSAVIAAEPDREGLCQLVKELCHALCK